MTWRSQIPNCSAIIDDVRIVSTSKQSGEEGSTCCLTLLFSTFAPKAITLFIYLFIFIFIFIFLITNYTKNWALIWQIIFKWYIIWCNYKKFILVIFYLLFYCVTVLIFSYYIAFYKYLLFTREKKLNKYT